MKKRWVCFIFFLFIADPCRALSADEKLATTFSQVQCEYLGLDWKETYEKVLAMNFDILRLGAYWNRIEKKEGTFDFSELDWQIQKAAEKKVQVLLTIGMKAPRWPEYFIPDWAVGGDDFRFGSAVSDRPGLQEKVLTFIRTVVSRYKKKNIIIGWQVENEPLSRAGPKELWIRKDFLQKEIDLVRELDNIRARPIVINAMTYPNSFLRFLTMLAYKKDPVAETIAIAPLPALDIYTAIGHKVLSKDICFWTSPRERIDYLKTLIQKAALAKKPVWVTELQAEPWEPGQLVHMREEPAITCGAQNFLQTFEELRSLGIKTIFLWGSEYWIYRQQMYHDDTWIKTFRQIRTEI